MDDAKLHLLHLTLNTSAAVFPLGNSLFVEFWVRSVAVVVSSFEILF